MFRKLTISARLYGLMGILSLILIGVGMAGVNGMHKLTVELEEMYHVGLEGTASVGALESHMNENIIEIFDGMQHDPRLAQTFADGHGVERHLDRMRARTADINAIFDTYVREQISTDAGREAAAELDAVRSAWVDEHLTPLIGMLESGNYDQASRVLVSRTLPAFRNSVLPKTEALIDQKAEHAEAQYTHALEQYAAQRWITIIAITLGVLLAGFLGWVVIARSFARPVNEVVAAANKMAAGEFDFEVKAANSEDEVGKLVTAVNSMQHSVQGFIGQMQHMSVEHDKGDIDVMIAPEDFEGDYRAMAEGVNGMVNGHIAVKKKAMACVGEFGRGNFEAELEKFPGKKRFINDTIEKVRENLKALIVDANMLSEAALAGELATRADAKRHEGDFRKIVEGVNATLDAVVVPVNEVKRVMVALSEGDLTQKIQGNYQGDFKVLQEAVDDSIDKLNELITGIKGSADAINTAAKEIAAGNTNLSQRTEEQASSLEETASSMEELTSTVKQNADNARQANQLAHGASDVASKGGDKVREVVVTMGAITESSKKIADIIQVIDGIAFQTNILALNAAVEAARAGEQGRGFAVVAGEVRTLAQRSAAAAKEIKTLINDSVDTVEGGSKLVEQAGATMEEIVSAVKRVTDIMAEISAASDEQSQGIEQVSTAVTQMDEVTQQNAALVEESAAAASSLEDQAHGLAQAVSVFRIDDAKPSGIAAPRSMAARAPAPTPSAAKANGSMPKAPARKAPKPAVAEAGEEWAEF